jgi:hypothetical protein
LMRFGFLHYAADDYVRRQRTRRPEYEQLCPPQPEATTRIGPPVINRTPPLSGLQRRAFFFLPATARPILDNNTFHSIHRTHRRQPLSPHRQVLHHHRYQTQKASQSIVASASVADTGPPTLLAFGAIALTGDSLFVRPSLQIGGPGPRGSCHQPCRTALTD